MLKLPFPPHIIELHLIKGEILVFSQTKSKSIIILMKMLKTGTLLTFLLILEIGVAGQLRENGVWGGWTGIYQAPPGYFICGAQMRLEPPQGSGDDTATNGFVFYFCNNKNWNQQTSKQYNGFWGNWLGKVMCSNGFYVNGFQSRFEHPCGRCDDTAFNGLQIHCQKPYTNQKQVKVVSHGYWGGWRGWKMAGINQFANSFQIRIQNPIGRGDDTALNGLVLRTASFSKIVGADFDYEIPEGANFLPETIGNSQVYNAAPSEQTKSITFSAQRVYSQKWQNTQRYLQSYSIQMSVSTDIPFINLATNTIITKQYQKSITFGEETTYTVSTNHEIEVRVPPCQYYSIKQMFLKADLDIPYTLKLTYESGHEQTINGIYSGVISSVVYTNITSSPIQACLEQLEDSESESTSSNLRKESSEESTKDNPEEENNEQQIISSQSNEEDSNQSDKGENSEENNEQQSIDEKNSNSDSTTP